MTTGPSGNTYENVNGKAVAIEMFLDLNFNHEKIPVIRWQSYNNKTNQYQGSLINKDSYLRKFINAKKT